MEDSKIIDMFWSRDEKAISETEKKYGAYCTAIARNILQNNEDTKECLNDTYLAVWNSIPPKRPERLSAFLGKICRNLAFNKYRYENRKKRGSGECAIILDELSECISGKDDVENTVDRNELVREINLFLKSLNDRQRAIFVLRYWYFCSIDEISSRQAMTISNVYTTLSRLREKLHIHLTERGYEI